MTSTEKPRVLHVTRSLSVAGGGTSEAVRGLCAGMTDLGVHTEVVCLDPPSAESYSVQMPCRVHWQGRRTGGYGYVPGLVAWLREFRGRSDVVVVHGLWQYGGLAVHAAFGARPGATGSGKMPYVVFPHGMLDPWFRRTYPLKHMKKWLYWPWGEYRVLRDADAVLFTSEEERLLARQSFGLYRCKEQVVPLGIVDPGAGGELQREAFANEFPHLMKRPFLLFLGRLHPKKGVELLIQAYGGLQREVPTLDCPDLVIAGSPAGTGDGESYQRHLQDLADQCCRRRSVTFAGTLQGDVKWGALRSSCAFVLPSHQENFGIAVVEALACGKPVLISDKVNIWREVVDDGAGMATADTLVGTRELLSRWTQLGENNRAEMNRHARRCFQQRFEIGGAVNRFLEVLRSGLRAEKLRSGRLQPA